jgi:hypothetical protein
MTALPRQRIGVSVSDCQIQMVLCDGGIGCQYTIPRDTCLHGCRQVIGQDPRAFDDRHAAQDFGVRDNRVIRHSKETPIRLLAPLTRAL